MAELVKLRLKPGVVAQIMGEEMILLDTARGHYFDLNTTGTFMVQQLLQGAERDPVVASVCARFHAEADIVVKDLDALLAQLRSAQLIED